MYGASTDFLPLMRREMAHFSHYIQLKSPLIKERIALIGSTSYDSDGWPSYRSISSVETPSGESTIFAAN